MNTCANLLRLLILTALYGCAVAPPESDRAASGKTDVFLRGSFSLPQQQAPPSDIQSVQLYRSGDPGSIPVIELDSEERLTLSFDYLDQQARQFRVEVSHRTRQWEESPIGPNIYLDSFFQTSITDAKKSLSPRPTYYQVEYEFPNNQLKPSVSGNYLLEVYGADGDEILFSQPFFITENEGELQTSIETLFAQREDRRSAHQLFSTYSYPDFVEYPQFDLSLSYVQRPFWGRMRTADQLDTVTPGELNGRLERTSAFIADYTFHNLDLQTFDADGRQIVEYQPEYTPPRVLLRRDVLHLQQKGAFGPRELNRGAETGRSGDYAQVHFFLETGESVSPKTSLYLVGEFNNWMITPLNRMSYNSDTDLWQVDALIKQGQYSYKYVVVRDNEIDDLSTDNPFITSPMEYLTFIYFKDPAHRFDRLLKVSSTSAR